jgi:FAD/FMN-containing dehydrogenase
MNKVASYLQSHISGEVLVGERIRQHFSTDASILTIKPSLVVHPRTTNDVRKVARFSWQLAERGHALPLTPRGNGTDLTGAAIGKGVILALSTHLNKILELDTKQRLVRVQPGVNFKSLQETLQTHGLFLPPAPESAEYSTIGGAIANNASGSRSFMYGDMSSWVDKLEVVLANGEVIQTGRVSKREVNKKLGLPTLEGELYRAVNAILGDSSDVIEAYQKAVNTSADNVGYAFQSLRHKNGDIDLTPLFIGAQGTLGIVTEAILRVADFTPASALVVAAFANMDDALEAAGKIADFKPSALDLVDADLYDFVQKHNSIELPSELLVNGKPGILLFAEAHNRPDRSLSKFTKQVAKTMSRYTESYLTASDIEDREKLWSYRYATAPYMSYDIGGKSVVPLVQGVTVPQAAIHQFMDDAKSLAKKHHLDSAIWVHVQSGEVVMMSLAELSKLGDRQSVFKLMDDYFKLVIKLGGSIATVGPEGRLRIPYAELQMGTDMLSLSQQLKSAVDPHSTMNPGVKTGTSAKELVDMLRKDYSLENYGDYLPRL